jgi:hypothetical protein
LSNKMDSKNKHRVNDFKKFLDYFRGLLSDKEKHAFEKEMMQDPFEEEAWEGLSQLPADELEADLYSLQGRIRESNQQKKNRFLPVFRYAAAAVLLVAAGITILLIRQSAEKASSLRELAQAEDTLHLRRKNAIRQDDSLNKNIAYIPEEKEEASPVPFAGQTGKIQPDRTYSSERSKAAPVAVPVENHTGSSTEYESPEDIVISGYEAEDAIVTSERPKETRQEPSEKAKSSQTQSPESSARIRSKAKDSEISAIAYADEIASGKTLVRGTVVASSNGEPLPGVNVIVKGTSQGTVSDIQGNFTLEVPSGSETLLTFNFIGYETKEFKVSDNKEITLAMNEDITSLDEVVVIGYGAQKKSDMTGAVSSVRTEDLDHQAPANPVVLEPRPVCKQSEYKDYISGNIRYDNLPAFDKEVVARLRFTVTAFGEIVNITVQKSAGKNFDNEAIRLLKEGPAWLPGTIDGIPADEEVNLKIKFEPPDIQ